MTSKEDIKKKEETTENNYEPVPNQLNINIRTSIPGHQFIQFKGANLKIDLGKDSHSVLFNPMIKIPQEIIKKIPESIRKTQFFKKGYYDSLMNYIKTKTTSKQTTSLSQAIQNGFIDNNIEFTIDCLFPENGIIYIGNRPFVIIDKQWTKGDWKIDIKNKPVEITSNDIKNPFLRAAIVQNEILAGKEQLENIQKMNIQGPNFVETPEYIAEKELRDQKEALEIMKLKKEIVIKTEKDEEMQKKIKENEDRIQLERQQREIEKEELEKTRKESEQLVRDALKKLQVSEDEKKMLLKAKDTSNADALKKIQEEIESWKKEFRKAKSELEKSKSDLAKANEKESQHAMVLKKNEEQLALVKKDLKTVSLISNKLDKLTKYYPPPKPFSKSNLLLKNLEPESRIEELEPDSEDDLSIQTSPELSFVIEKFKSNPNITRNLNNFLNKIYLFLLNFSKGSLIYKNKKTVVSVRTPSGNSADFLDAMSKIITYCNYFLLRHNPSHSAIIYELNGKKYGGRVPITKDILQKLIDTYYGNVDEDNYSYEKAIKALRCLLNLNIVIIEDQTIIKMIFVFQIVKCVSQNFHLNLFFYIEMFILVPLI